MFPVSADQPHLDYVDIVNEVALGRRTMETSVEFVMRLRTNISNTDRVFFTDANCYQVYSPLHTHTHTYHVQRRLFAVRNSKAHCFIFCGMVLHCSHLAGDTQSGINGADRMKLLLPFMVLVCRFQPLMRMSVGKSQRSGVSQGDKTHICIYLLILI